jgi:hypothetical protein
MLVCPSACDAIHLVRAEDELLARSSLVKDCLGTAGKLSCILDGGDCRFGFSWSGAHRQTLAMQTEGDQLVAAAAAAGGGGGGGTVRAASKFSIHAEQQ